MKIKDIRTTLLSVPLNPPIADSTHVLNHIQWILVDVFTDDGLVGNAFMLTFDYGPELLRGIVDTELKKLVLGKDPRDISGIWQMCYAHCEYIGQSGVAAWGIAAIDIALWDLLGKQLGVPVCQLFGSNREQVPIYGSGGWLSYSMDELLAEASAYLQRGFTMVKMKVGSADLKRDVERVRAVRKLVGDKVQLMVDANQAFTPPQAIAFARQVEDQDLFWFEEPVGKEDLDGEGASILQPDALRIGGLSQCLKVAHLAESFNRLLAPHFYKEIDVHVLAAIRNGLYLEYFDWLDKLLVHPLEVSNGMAKVPRVPGLGIEFKPEAVKEYRVG
jgi:L-alanine-DL-glutamate epimerase-like enolase superfamily enzyme